jgi:hypothetical protein
MNALLRVHYAFSACAFSPAGARLSRYELDELAHLVPPNISALPPRFVLAAYRVMPPLVETSTIN